MVSSSLISVKLHSLPSGMWSVSHRRIVVDADDENLNYSSFLAALQLPEDSQLMYWDPLACNSRIQLRCDSDLRAALDAAK